MSTPPPTAEAPVTPPAAAPPPAAPPAAAPRSGSNTLTWALVAAALVVAGFLGGYFVGHHTATDHLAMTARRAFAGRPGFGAGGGFRPGPAFGGVGGNGNGGGASANPGFGPPSISDIAVGTVTRVSGSTIYLHERSGTNVKVETDSSTQLRLQNGNGVSSLKPGSTIFVRGTPDGTGVLRASGIFEAP